MTKKTKNVNKISDSIDIFLDFVGFCQFPARSVPEIPILYIFLQNPKFLRILSAGLVLQPHIIPHLGSFDDGAHGISAAACCISFVSIKMYFSFVL